MKKEAIGAAECKIEIAVKDTCREKIPGIVDKLVSSCRIEDSFDHVGPEPIPSREAVINILECIKRILYPGYFIQERIDWMNVRYYYGQEVTGLFEALSEQIVLAIRHECIRHNLPCTHCEERGSR